MDIRKGQRVALDDLLGNVQTCQIALSITGVAVEFACFGLNAQQKLADDAYMTFYNQPKTPCGAVSLLSGQLGAAVFLCQLALLPEKIDRLVFTAAIEDSKTLAVIVAGTLSIENTATKIGQFAFSGQDFIDEKAVMIGEIYRKDGGWRFAANGQGFNGGLAALVSHFGGEVAEDAKSSVVPKLSLEKKLAETAPKLVNLAKKAQVSLEKHCLLDTVARVGLVLDASGSMSKQYSLGKVQAVVERLLPLAVHFDDDGELDVWAFSVKALALPPATLKNYTDYIGKIENGWRNWGMMSINNEPAVIEQVIARYQDSQLPVFILFISDGGISQNSAIKKLLISASEQPIFWQFVGLGGNNYGILEKLDTMTGRAVDNCGFFALDDIDSINEQTLYDRLLSEFPVWLSSAKQKAIIR